MTTLAEALDSFLKVDRSPYTTGHYRSVLTKFVAALGPDTDLASITLPRLLDYNDALKQKMAATSLQQHTLVIKSFFSWCDRVDLIGQSPARKLHVRVPPRDPTKNRAIPAADIERMCRYAYPSSRDYALILFYADTGARVGGVLSLQLSRLELDQGHAVLLEKGHKFVHVYFWGETVVALRRLLAERPPLDHDFVFTTTGKHKPLTHSGMREIIRRVSIRACGKEYGWHGFRHHVAQMWEEAGESPYNIQHKLNHVDVRTTTGSYLRNVNPHIQEASRRLSLRNVHGVSHAGEPEAADNIIYLDGVG